MFKVINEYLLCKIVEYGPIAFFSILSLISKKLTFISLLDHRISSDPFTVLENTDVYVDFGFLSNTPTTEKVYLTSRVVFSNKALDIAIVELQSSGGQSIPGPLTLSPNTLLEHQFFFVGHPGGEFKQLNPIDGFVKFTKGQMEIAVQFSQKVNPYNSVLGTNGYEGIDNPDRILFNCSFQKGGSGSPGLAVVGSEPVVTTVLLHGYPDWFYEPTVAQHKKNEILPGNKLEQGVKMESLHELLQVEAPGVFKDIFRGNVGTPMDEE